MIALHQFRVIVNGEEQAPLIMDLYSSNNEILALLRKNRLISVRKAEFAGSIRDHLELTSSQGTITLINVSLTGDVPPN